MFSKKNLHFFFHIGRYFFLMKKVFSRPEKTKIYLQQLIKEIDKLGLNSLWIVGLISLFFGAVISMQSAYGMQNTFLPRYLVGYATRDSIILEFSSSIVALILSGKVGSNIASELGTMRVSEQIDALEIMGVNSASYLILPKIIALTFIIPFLVIFSIIFGLLGGLLVSFTSEVFTFGEYLQGLQFDFKIFYIEYTIIKAFIFAFIISSVASYFGYYTKGGALEVGKSSTKAVVNCSILILFFNVLITKILLITA